MKEKLYNDKNKSKVPFFIRKEERGGRRMLTLKSTLTKQELIARWDDRTAPARFAGNEDLEDNIFMATRKGDKVTLIRKARGAWDPFATIFKGSILSDGEHSVLEGTFGKRTLDYLILIGLGMLDFLFYFYASPERQTKSMMGFCILFAVVLIVLALPTRSAKKRYRQFLEDITQTEKDEK